jgi:hypothetical protein
LGNTIYIHSYCHLKNNTAIVNGIPLPIAGQGSVNEFLKTIYQHLLLDYPKFFKMDELCKLAFIGSELVLKNFPIQESSEGETAIVMANSSSTLMTDRKHQDSINDDHHYFPSPAVFVYTLPNITIGEITIRHRLKGENTFFVTEKYDIGFMVQYTNSLLQNGLAKSVLTGWVEYGSDGYEAFLYRAGKPEKGTALEHIKANVDKLYNSLPSV